MQKVGARDLLGPTANQRSTKMPTVSVNSWPFINNNITLTFENDTKGQIELNEHKAFNNGSQRVNVASVTSLLMFSSLYISQRDCNSLAKGLLSFSILVIKLFHLLADN